MPELAGELTAGRRTAHRRRRCIALAAMMGVFAAFAAMHHKDMAAAWFAYRWRTGGETAQENAQSSLERLGLRYCLPVARRLATADSPRARFLAIDTLGRLGDRADASRMVSALGDCDSEVRLRAVQLLPRWRTADTVAVLGSLLDDADTQLRVATAQSLGSCPGIGAEAILAHALIDPDAQVGGFAIASLRQLTGNRFGYRFAAPAKQQRAALRRWREWARAAGLTRAMPPLSWRLAKLMKPRRMPAPRFVVAGRDGVSLRLASYRGKVLLLDFFSPACAECLAELPAIRETYDHYRAQGLEVLVVSANLGHDGQLARYAGRHRWPFPVLMANARMVADYGDIREVPVTLLLDRRGRIYRRYQGSRDAIVLERDVRKLVQERGDIGKR